MTHAGNTVQHPRWIPDSAWPDHAGELLLYQDDGHTRSGFWALPLVRDAQGRVTGSREDRRDLMIRTNGVGSASFMPDGTAVFSANEIHDNIFVFDDLFELPAHEKSPGGIDGKRVRWTDGWRAIDPSVSPDGRRVVFTTNHRGTTYLMMADVAPSKTVAGQHELVNVRPLVRSVSFDQAFTPRWSPDNRHVAYSAWTHGGYRDVRIVDTADGSFVEVTHDRAVDAGPCYSADGRWLYFSSDRTGIMNVYAYEVATGRLRQVTNVVGGAYQPEPSPDGRQLAYVGYTHAGYDVYVIGLDESQWLDALPYVDTRPAPPAEPPPLDLQPKSYNPWNTLLPRAYTLMSAPGNYGQAWVASAEGSDITGFHSIVATMTTEQEHPDPQFSLQYGYGKLPFDVGFSVSRSVAPASDYGVGGTTVTYPRETIGARAAISYSMPPSAFESNGVALSYTFDRVGAQLPATAAFVNPYGRTNLPFLGMLGALHVGWGYSNAEGYLWSVGNETGSSVSAAIDVSHPYLASDYIGYAASASYARYLRMPWLRHHALALHLAGGSSGGNFGGAGAFYTSGYVELEAIDVLRNYLIQGSVVLRGYPTGAEVGHYFGLLNAEYRFPIVNVDRGVSTLPVFLNRVSGSAFFDYGSAFDDPTQAQLRTGVGVELWFDLTLGYVLGFPFRLGYARGLATGGIDKVYLVAAVEF